MNESRPLAYGVTPEQQFAVLTGDILITNWMKSEPVICDLAEAHYKEIAQAADVATWAGNIAMLHCLAGVLYTRSVADSSEHAMYWCTANELLRRAGSMQTESVV